jgi:flagellar hook-associated protein 1
MSLTSAMYNAGTGLASASRYTDLVSNNIANAQTAGYARRDLIVSEQVLAGQGIGVDEGVVKRAEASYLMDSVRTTNSVVQKQTVIEQNLGYFENELGDLTSKNTISANIDAFAESLRDLAETPESYALQQNGVSTAKDLSRQIVSLATNVQILREKVDKQISQDVDIVNGSLDKLDLVLKDLQTYNSRGLDNSALLDQKDRLLTEISKHIPIKTIARDDGSLYIYASEGSSVLYDHGANHLSFYSAFGASPQSVYSPTPATVTAPYVASLSGLTVQNGTITVDITPSSGLPTAISNGSLGGLFDLRDKILPQAQNQLDAIASSLIKSFRTADTTSGTGDSLFTSSAGIIDFSVSGSEVGVAQTLIVNSAFDGTLGGTPSRLRDGVSATTEGPASNDVQLRAFINALTSKQTFAVNSSLSSNQSLISSAKDFMTRQLNQIENIRTDLDASTARLKTVEDTHDNLVGVNMDDETQKLTMLGQLYASNANVLKIATQMFETLLDSIQ